MSKLDILETQTFYSINIVLLVVALSTAYIAEYVFSILPCALCLKIRYCYIVFFLFNIFGKLLNNKYIYYLTGSIICIGFCYSIYHWGVEKHIWDAFGKIHKTYQMYDNTQIALSSFATTINLYKNNSNWKIFGISATVWDILLFLFFLFYWVKVLMHKVK